MKRAIFPGSFDPFTNGHLDIVVRSLGLFDEIIIAILNNPDKLTLFSSEKRCSMISKIVAEVDSNDCILAVESFEGLLVDFVRERKGGAILRGIRAVSDYEYELSMALMNRHLAPAIETVFLMAAEEYSFVSSRLVKQVFELGGDISDLVPKTVGKEMQNKLRDQ